MQTHLVLSMGLHLHKAKPLLGHLTDRVIFYMIGLAPEIPEDLYMLIKKVRRSPIAACLVENLR